MNGEAARRGSGRGLSQKGRRERSGMGENDGGDEGEMKSHF